MRPLNPFTARQTRFLESLKNRLRTISDPDPEIITHETFTWKIKDTKQFGKIPTLWFKPHGAAARIKQEVLQEAGLYTDERNTELDEIGRRIGIMTQTNREARLFNSELDNLMFGLKKHLYASALINSLFAHQGQHLAEPITLLQSIIMEEYNMTKQTNEPIYEQAHETEQPEEPAQTLYAQEMNGEQ